MATGHSEGPWAHPSGQVSSRKHTCPHLGLGWSGVLLPRGLSPTPTLEAALPDPADPCCRGRAAPPPSLPPGLAARTGRNLSVSREGCLPRGASLHTASK